MLLPWSGTWEQYCEKKSCKNCKVNHFSHFRFATSGLTKFWLQINILEYFVFAHIVLIYLLIPLNEWLTVRVDDRQTGGIKKVVSLVLCGVSCGAMFTRLLMSADCMHCLLYVLINGVLWVFQQTHKTTSNGGLFSYPRGWNSIRVYLCN